MNSRGKLWKPQNQKKKKTSENQQKHKYHPQKISSRLLREQGPSTKTLWELSFCFCLFEFCFILLFFSSCLLFLKGFAGFQGIASDYVVALGDLNEGMQQTLKH